MSEPREDIYVQLAKNKKSKQVQQEFVIPETDDIDQLINALYALVKHIREMGWSSQKIHKGLSPLRYALLYKIQQALKKIEQSKADAIKQKLFDELGILLP